LISIKSQCYIFVNQSYMFLLLTFVYNQFACGQKKILKCNILSKTNILYKNE
jgi:hypothetical protein